MKISILSDFHFGFSPRSELEEDSFDNAEEAIERSLSSDLILIAGDIFDSRLPKTSTWAKAIKILVRPLLKEKTVDLVECSKELKEISKRTLNHLPVIAIHGTHERRGKDEINSIGALENAGILIHLHCQTIVFEKDGTRIALHGMSGVPERFAKDVLSSWDPKPVPNCFNILVLHQSIDPFVYSPIEPPSLNLSNLPKGFDLIVDGHIHSHRMERIDDSILAIPGSTVITQLEKNESELEKGFFEVDVENKKIDFILLDKNRKFFYEEVTLEKNLPIREQIEKKINDIVYTRKLPKIPLIKVKIFGKETEVIDRELRDIERKYSGKAFVKFVKELESSEITQKLEFLRNLRDQKLSTEEIGIEVLRKNLEELKFDATFDYGQTFSLLSEGEVNRTFDILLGEQITLDQVLKKPLVEKI